MLFVLEGRTNKLWIHTMACVSEGSLETHSLIKCDIHEMFGTRIRKEFANGNIKQI
jgi:hypothetical protein